MSAYLSTFLHANEWIINNGKCNDVRDYSKNSVGYHTAIHIALTKLNKRKIARKYKEFINLRVNADYNIVTIITLQDAQKAIDLAKLNYKSVEFFIFPQICVACDRYRN